MKKLLAILSVFLFIAVFAVSAQEKTAAADNSEVISVCFFPGVPEPANIVDCYGLKLGIPVSFGEKSTTYGIEASFLVSMSNYVKGVQTATIYTCANTVSGLQAAIGANVADSVCGMQFGIVNIAKEEAFQLGLVNIIQDSPLPFMIICNCWF